MVTLATLLYDLFDGLQDATKYLGYFFNWNFVTKNFQKSPNLVTLATLLYDLSDGLTTTTTTTTTLQKLLIFA